MLFGIASTVTYISRALRFQEGWRKYVENLCFVTNTFYFPMDKSLPLHQDAFNTQGEVRYYQWVPFALAFSALLFYIPKIAWKMLSSKSNLLRIDFIPSWLHVVFRVSVSGVSFLHIPGCYGIKSVVILLYFMFG